AQLIRDPQVVANGYIAEYDHRSGERRRMVGPAVQLGATPGSIRRGAPEFDEHTEEVLLEFGFGWDEVERLRSAGAIGSRG
ncbi:MAG: CoA transferase, partial [Tepidiforma sp.]